MPFLRRKEKTMKLLDDLMAKVPKLPWDGAYESDIIDGAAYSFVEVLDTDWETSDVRDYLLLSANHLPAAVEAMEKAADMMMSAGFYVAGAAMNEALHDYERKIRAVLSAIEADLKETEG